MNSLRPRFPDNDIKLRIKSPHRPGKLGLLLTVLGEEGALVGDIETLFIGKDHSFRNITISIFDEVHLDAIKTAIKNRTEVEILEIEDIVFKRHEGGKIHSKRKQELRRLGIPVAFSANRQTVQLVLSQAELARTGRTSRV